MENRHPVEGSLGNEFSSVYNHCGVMGGLKSQDIEKKVVFAFLEKRPLREIFKILFRENSSWHRLTCCVQISRNLSDGKLVKSCVAYLTKISPGSPGLASAQIAPKIWQGLLRVLQISFKSVHFRRSYTRTRDHRQNWLLSVSNIRLKPSFEPNKKNKNMIEAPARILVRDGSCLTSASNVMQFFSSWRVRNNAIFELFSLYV